MSITFLNRQSAADDTSITGNAVASNDPWIMRLSNPSSSVTAYNAIEIGGASFGFPLRGDSHPDLESLKMIDYGIAHHNSEQEFFIVTVNYSNDRELIDLNTATNPLDLPISYSYDQVDLATPVLFDAETGNEILNLLGKPPTSPLIENKPLTRITVVKNERRYDNDRAEDIRNTLNRAPQRINGKTYNGGTAKLERFTGNNQFDQDGREYYIITYQILINKEGFKRKLAERGTVNKFGRSPNGLVIHSDGAAFLDEDGTFRDPTADPRAIYTEWNTLEEKSWSLRL